jgi:CHAT domain-containing protein/Flp pilus assembly protein TadD
MNNRFSIIMGLILAISAFPNYLMAQEVGNRGVAIAQINSSQGLLAQGKAQYAANEFTEAIQLFQQALKTSQAQKDVNGSIEALNGMGRSYNAIGRYQKAIDSHQQALKLIPATKANSLETVRTLTWLGDASLNLGNDEKGLEIMERAIALTEKISVPLIDQGETIHNLGRAYSRNGRYPQALKTFNQALLIRQKVGDRFNEGRTLNAIAGVYTQQQDFAKALEFAERGLKLNREAKNQLGIAASLYNTGSIYGIIGQVPKSVEMLQQSLAVYEGFGDRLSIGDVLNQISNINAVGFKFTEGLKLDLIALDIFREYGDQRRIQAGLEEIASSYANVTQYPKALDFYAQALKAVDQITDPELSDRIGKGNILYRMAEIYGTQGQHQQAISTYEKAAGIYATALALPNPRPRWKDILAGIYRGLGDSQGSLSQYPKSVEALQKSLKLYEEIGDRRGEIVVLLRIAPIYIQLGQLEKAASATQQAKALSITVSNENAKANKTPEIASTPNPAEGKPNPLSLSGFKPNLPANVLQNLEDLDSVKRDLEFFKKSGNRSFEASSYSVLGHIYSERQDYAQSLISFEQALKIYTEIGDRNAMANILFDIGLQNALSNQNLPAYYAYQKSLAVYRELGNRNQESEVLSSLGLVFKFNQPELAIAFYKQSVNVTESIRKELKVLPKNQQQAFQQKIAGTYRSLADLLLRQGRVMEALQVLDLLKVQELQDYLQNVKGNERTAQGIRLLQPEQEISKQLASQPDRLAELSKQLTNQIKNLPKSELNQVPKYLQNLPSGVVLLYPLILSDRLELIMFSANNPPISRTVAIKGSEFEELIKDFRSDLQNPISQDVKISGKKVYDLMIKPLVADLKQANANTILYAPDGILRYIPLGALYDGKQWLVEKYQVSNLIAYSLLNLERQSSQSKPNTNLRIFAGAFGGREGETRFGNKGLPATITEVNNITKTYTNANKFVEQNFTAKNIKEKLAGNAIVHLATHALFNSGSPLESFILFGDGSKVTLAEINEWKLKDADLVVLSACETGVGTFGTGAEFLGFGYQVQRAGAKAAIASLWTVSDSGTQLLMSGFYQNLKTQNILTALRESQLTMIRKPIKTGEVNFNHPYFWSSFVAIGNSL